MPWAAAVPAKRAEARYRENAVSVTVASRSSHDSKPDGARDHRSKTQSGRVKQLEDGKLTKVQSWHLVQIQGFHVQSKATAFVSAPL